MNVRIRNEKMLGKATVFGNTVQRCLTCCWKEVSNEDVSLVPTSLDTSLNTSLDTSLNTSLDIYKIFRKNYLIRSVTYETYK